MRKRTSWYKLVFIGILLLWTLFPIYWMISLSIRNGAELHSSLPLIPQSFTFEHFSKLFSEKEFGRALLNSIQGYLHFVVFCPLHSVWPQLISNPVNALKYPEVMLRYSGFC